MAIQRNYLDMNSEDTGDFGEDAVSQNQVAVQPITKAATGIASLPVTQTAQTQTSAAGSPSFADLINAYNQKGAFTTRQEETEQGTKTYEDPTDLGGGWNAWEKQGQQIGTEGQGESVTPIYDKSSLGGFSRKDGDFVNFYDTTGKLISRQKWNESGLKSMWKDLGPLAMAALTAGGGAGALGNSLFGLTGGAAAGVGGALAGGVNAGLTGQNILTGALKGGLGSAGAMELGDILGTDVNLGGKAVTLGDVSKAVNLVQNPSLSGLVGAASSYLPGDISLGDTGLSAGDLMKGVGTAKALASGDERQIFNAIVGAASSGDIPLKTSFGPGDEQDFNDNLIEGYFQSGGAGDTGSSTDLSGDIDSLADQLGLTRDELETQITGLGTNFGGQLSDVQTGLESKISGTQDSVDQLATELGTTKEELLTQLGTTEDELNQQITDLGADFSGQLSDVESGLDTKITDLGKDLGGDIDAVANELGLTKDELKDDISSLGADLGGDIDALATELGTTKQDLLNQLGQTEEEFTNQIADLGADFGDQLSDLSTDLGGDIDALADELGLTKGELKDDIADLGADLGGDIDALADELGTTKQDLLDQLGTTEDELRGEITDLGTDLSGDIDSLADQLGLTREELTTQMDELGLDLSGDIDSLADELGLTREELSGDIGDLSSDIDSLADQLGLTREELTTQMDELGLDLSGDIDSLADELGLTREELSGDIEDLSKETKNALAEQSTQTKQQFKNLSDQQKVQTDALVKQGQTLSDAINQVQSSSNLNTLMMLMNDGQQPVQQAPMQDPYAHIKLMEDLFGSDIDLTPAGENTAQRK